jgi:hypothetical protein
MTSPSMKHDRTDRFETASTICMADINLLPILYYIRRLPEGTAALAPGHASWPL